ncbi:MAG: sulfotransferase domain-containing protein [candidate division KSB1 bacterium]|nr:sulfotransferase domain-containing protein [candidate division KSB1 bacterium]MDZ7301497.1 sulfotransferase domain-containing protein [candidate division KSB1 bacterium]MDZ7310899.1 sulfotransferase domain-containing protein [candidate division KSB1 bacterium]
MVTGYFARLRKQNPLVRKSLSLFKQVPRFGVALLKSGEPPHCLLANSFPKSGTHLLKQVLSAFPGTRNYDSFIASIPPIRFKERSQRTLLRRISWIVPGELVAAHLHYSPACHQALRAKGCVHYLIIRDPRDVVVSDVHYLTFMHKYHRLHHYFAHKLSNMSERIRCAIEGIPAGTVPFYFPDIGQRFRPFLPWFDQKEVCVVRYEELTSERRQACLHRMLAFYGDITGTRRNHEEILRMIERNIVPENSHTFRKGGSGGWREVFEPEHKQLMKEIAGELLIRLGYEKDLDW